MPILFNWVAQTLYRAYEVVISGGEISNFMKNQSEMLKPLNSLS